MVKSSYGDYDLFEGCGQAPTETNMEHVMSLDLIIKNGQVWTASGPKQTDVGVLNGKIVALGKLDLSAKEVIDADGLDVLPGAIDTQVHFREPGLEHKENLESGTRSAVMGGITGVFEMPNTKPGTTTMEAMEDKMARAAHSSWCEYAFYVGAAGDNVEQLATLENLPGVCGVKVFMGSSTGSLLVSDDETLARVLASGRRRVAIHAEDEARLIARKEHALTGDPSTHPVWRDTETAILATKRILRLAKEAHRRIHVLHVTTSDEVDMLAAHKDLVTAEVTPQHLTLHAPDCYERLGTHAQMNPPIRENSHRIGLWRGVEEGVFDLLGSDHAPHTLEEKAQTYPNTPSGMTGVQTILPVMLRHVAEGRMTMERLIDMICTGPARVFGLVGKGRIARGFDADFSIINRHAQHKFTRDQVCSRSGWSPFEDEVFPSWPVMTIIRGNIVMREGKLSEAPLGESLRFFETEQVKN